MRVFVKVNKWALSLIFIVLPLGGFHKAFAVDPAQGEKDRLLVQEHKDINDEYSKILREIISHRELGETQSHSYYGLSSLYGSNAVDLTYSALADRNSSFLRKVGAASGAAVAGILGTSAGLILQPLAGPLNLGSRLHNFRANVFNAKLYPTYMKLEKSRDEMSRIQNKDTPLTWTMKRRGLDKRSKLDKKSHWERVKALIDQGADFSEQDSETGPLQSAASLAQAEFGQQYTDYMIEHEKKVTHHITEGVDSVCVKSEVDLLTNTKHTIKMPMDVIHMITAYVSDESESKRKVDP